jgi:hypothetical protein
MEQIGEFRNKSDLCKGCQRHKMEEEYLFSTWFGKTGNPPQKNETGPLYSTIKHKSTQN